MKYTALSDSSPFRGAGLETALLSVAVAMGCGITPQPPRPYNVLIILVDTLRADHLDLYGYDRETAPFLRRFARTGIVFEHARSQAGCTFPSVNSLLTSQWPQVFVNNREKHGIGIPKELPNVAGILRENGYETRAVSASAIVRANPSRHNPTGGFGTGFELFDDSCLGKPASCVNRIAIDFLSEVADPFFLYLHYMEPHRPYRPPASHNPRFAGEYAGKEWIAKGTLDPINDWLYKNGPPVDYDPEDIAHAVDLYDEEIVYFDTQLAELIAYLEEHDLLENTLVVFAADHGEELLDHGNVYHCRDLVYDTVIKTPLVLWIPEVREGIVSGALVQNLDIVPTLLDYLGIDSSGLGLKGVSMRPIIEDEQPIHHYIFSYQRFVRSVTGARYKYLLNVRTGEEALFDLDLDPGETVDILATESETAARLRARLLGWISEVEGAASLPKSIEKARMNSEMLRALGYL